MRLSTRLGRGVLESGDIAVGPGDEHRPFQAADDHARDVAAGSAELQAAVAAARKAGLTNLHAEERPVDVGVTEPAQLVRYRFGHPIFADWLDAIGTARADTLAATAEQAIRDGMQPSRPVVVFLSALAPA